MPPHDDIVAAILDVIAPAGGEVRLVGRLNDPLIGNRSDHEVFLFIPDLHLVTPLRRAQFAGYGFNHEESGLLARILFQLAALRRQWKDADGHDLVTIQLGDFFDLWREFPDAFDPGAIPDTAHGALRDALYRGTSRGKLCLEAALLLGNHDTKGGQTLPGVRFLFKAFDRSPQPFLFATHGDAFDVLERLAPDAIQEFCVSRVAAQTPVNVYSIDQWGREAESMNKPLNQLRDCIVAPRHDLAAVRAAPVVQPSAVLPERLVQTIKAPADADHPYFGKFYEAIAEAGTLYPEAARLRVVVVGHTHRAAMILCEPPDAGRAMLLIDSGAWIEECVYHVAEDVVVTEPSAQLTVLHGNDARLYQIRIPA
jgi:UDP-2,3-diacylglucosamine pyrophosphatase LpxH